MFLLQFNPLISKIWKANIRPSSNPIDAMGFIKMRNSGDVVDGYSDIQKIHKLEFFSSSVSICVFTLRSSFVYKGVQNSDLATI